MGPRTMVVVGAVVAAVIAVGGCGYSTAPSQSAGGASPGVAASPSAAARSIGPGEPWIVYQAYFTANDLGLIRPDGSDAHRLAGGPGNRMHPDWSPDGQWIAYDYDMPTSREIWIGRPDGSEDRLLVPCESPCDGAEGPAWTLDGTAVGFDSADVTTPDHPDGVCYLGVVQVASGDIRRIFEIPGCKGGGPDGQLGELYFMRFSPDAGEFVVQGDAVDGRTAIFVGSTAGGAIRQLTDWGLGGRPDWSPDGDWIVFMSGDPDHGGQAPITLHRIRPDGTGLEQLTTASGDSIDSYPRYLHDGSGILYSRCPGFQAAACEARRMSVDGATDEVLFTPPGFNPVHVIWRPGTPTG